MATLPLLLLGSQAVYTVLREAEYRSTFPIAYWNIPGAMQVRAPPRPAPHSRPTQPPHSHSRRAHRQA